MRCVAHINTVRYENKCRSTLLRSKINTHLLVSEHEQDGLAQFVLVEHTVKLIPCGVDAVSVVRVHHEDQTLRVLVVVPPQRSDLVLSSDVPNYRESKQVMRRDKVGREVRSMLNTVVRSAQDGAKRGEVCAMASMPSKCRPDRPSEPL